MCSALDGIRPGTESAHNMATWRELQTAQPELARMGEALLYQHGVGLAFLATVRSDGGPRVHPMCPILHDGHLYGLIVPSPKRADLTRDGRYAMHSFPADDNEDACYLSGTARVVHDAEVRATIDARFREERRDLGAGSWNLEAQTAFEFDIETCLVTTTTTHGDPNPNHKIWHDPKPVST